jgi:cytochrome P450
MAVLLNPIDPGFLADPYPTYARLREEAPVYRHPGGFVAVSRYADVQTVLRTPDVFSSRAMGGGPVRVRDPEALPLGSASLISLDPPEHARVRGIVSRGFTPRRIADLEPRALGVLDELFAKFLHAGACDLVAAVSAPLPVTMIAELLGLDPARRDDFKRWSNALIVESTSLGSQRRRDDLLAVMREFRSYLLTVIAARRESPADDLISVLVHAEEADGTLDAVEVLAFAALLLAAGSETTTNLIGNALLALLDHPDLLAAVAGDPSRVPAVLEETLRWDSPVQLLMRVTTRATQLAGVELGAGTLVMVLLGAANRDSSQFPDADRFDPDRPSSGHLGFGFGTHFCLGAALARLEARVALERILVDLREPRLASPAERHGSFLVRGPKVLDLRFGG